MAYINDSTWNVLTFNESFRDLFPGGKAPGNSMRWMALDVKAREETLLDWETRWAPLVFPQLRHAVQLRPTNTELLRIEEEVRNDPVAGPLYRDTADMPIPYPDGSERPINHAIHGPGWVTTCVAEPVTSPGARLMLLVYTPGTRPSPRTPPLRMTEAVENGSAQRTP
ncbi:hypothetical protein LRE75_33275 [Streptomyces sp. 372A]